MINFSTSQLALLTEFRTAAKEVIRHRPKLTFYEWAPLNLVNPDGSKFAFRSTQKQIARDLFNPALLSVSLRAYSGMGKTYGFSAGICYAIEQMQESIGVMFPNKSAVEGWVGAELQKVIDATPSIANLRMDRDVMSYKSWMNGANLTALGSNSSTLIRRLQASIMFADEIDAVVQTITDEGDKVDQFLMRGRGRRKQYKWLTSYPSIKGHSKIDARYNQSDGCRWYVNCHRCGHQYEMHTKQMVWTPGKPQTARLICPACEVEITDEQRFKMADSGLYLNREMETPAESGVARGFHVNCMSHVGDSNMAYDGYLHEIAAEMEGYKNAANPEKARQVFVNTRDAESFAEESETKPEPDDLYSRRESDWNPNEMLPAGVLVLTAGVDIQKNRIEVIILGHGLNAEIWTISYRVILGSFSKIATQSALDELLAKPWRHEIGPPLKPICTLVDSGNWRDTVYAYTRPRYRRSVYACKGAKALDRPLMDGKPTKQGRPAVMLYNVGTNEAKDLIYQRLELEQPPEDATEYPRGYIHVPRIDEFGPDAGGEATGFFEMLLAEDSQMKRSTATGEFVRAFDCPKGVRNEALDVFVYALAAERIKRPKYELIARKMIEKAS
tara:strand:+ start:8970 stop:10811 length:1842 start_codon:yes stop_codon:yes gene_type:complete